MGALVFLLFFLIPFFLKLIVVYVREDNDSSV